MKKLLSTILVVAMLFSVVACNTTETSPSSSASEDKPESSSVDSESEPEVSKEKYEAIDLKGRVIRIASNDAPVFTSDQAPDKAEATPTDILKYEHLKEVEKKYNCKIEFITVAWDQMLEKATTSILEGAPYADVLKMDAQHLAVLAPKDMLLPYDEFLPDNADILTDNVVFAKGTKFFGENYTIETAEKSSRGYYLGVNLDIINELGLENPIELYEKGEWTWDKFMELAKAATKDTNNDGENDTYGLSGVPYLVGLTTVASNGGQLINSERTVDFQGASTLEALDFVKKMYVDEKIAYLADNDVYNWDGNNSAYTQGKSAMFLVESWQLNNGLEFEYSVVPFPQGPKYDGANYFFKIQNGNVIPKGIEDPKVVYQVYEELQNWHDGDVDLLNEGSQSWMEQAFATEEDIERVYDAATNNGKYEIAISISGFPFGNVVGGIVKDGKTPAQAAQEQEPVAQEAVDTLFVK